ncbi:MAG: DUF192 domain-containing protein [Patescibacteria group bacterium]
MYYVNKRTIIAGAILFTLLTGLIGYFVYDQFFSDSGATEAEASEVGEPTIVIETDPWEDYDVTTRSIDGQELRLLVADTSEKRKQGLMFVQELGDYDGMLFIFDTVGVKSFWNKNTYLNLELIWLNNGDIVGRDNLPAISESGETVTIESPAEVNEVIEVVQ